MKCEELAWESRGSRPLSAEEQAHVDGCRDCQLDRELQHAMAASEGPSEAIDEKLRAAAHEQMKVQPKGRGLARAATFVPWLVLLAAVAMMRVRPDLMQLPTVVRAGVPLLLLAAFQIARRALLAPGLVPRGRWLASLGVLLGAGAMLAFPGAREDWSGNPPACLWATLGVSALPFIVFVLWARRSRDWKTGAVAGLAAGAIGVCALFFHCPYSGAAHLLSTHLLAWLILAGLGAGLVTLFPERIWKPGRAP
ncbi:MAG: DUF1109 family protein [Deltaproteobacteria bacterium]|nr:DUF1109 family protein [Deltaproteobacteria bacterium]